MPIKNLLDNCAKTIHQKSFYTAYHKTFSAVRVDSEELLEEVFKLRYDVYCRENGYIDPKVTKGELERDIYDRHSLHSLLIHKPSGRPVGTARVVLAREDKPLRSFPLQSACDHPMLYMEDRVQNMCEISRLCMTKAFRRRDDDGNFLPAYYEADWEKKPEEQEKTVYFRRMIPYAPLGLIMSTFEAALSEGISSCFCIMDRDQLHAFKKIGFDYRVLGPRIEFFGTQQPIVFDIKSVLDNMLMVNAPCWDIVSDGGRLQTMANKLTQEQWQDNVFNKQVNEKVLDHVMQ